MDPELPRDPLLAALDPTRDGARWRALAARIAADARPELARRARVARLDDPLLLLSGWLRPALYAATAAAALAIAVLSLSPAENGIAAPGIAEALGWPAAVADWVEAGGSPPPVDELLAADLTPAGDPR